MGLTNLGYPLTKSAATAAVAALLHNHYFSLSLETTFPVRAAVQLCRGRGRIIFSVFCLKIERHFSPAPVRKSSLSAKCTWVAAAAGKVTSAFGAFKFQQRWRQQRQLVEDGRVAGEALL